MRRRSAGDPRLGAGAGVYRAARRADANGDDDQTATRGNGETALARSHSPVELPPRQAWVWEARQVARPAAAPGDRTWPSRPRTPLVQRRSLTIRVHNIGCTATKDLSSS